MQRKANDRAHIELVTVYEIGKILGASLDIRRTFRQTLNVIAAHLDIPRLLIVLGHEDGALHPHSAFGLSAEQVARGRWRPGEGVVGRVYSSGMPIVVPDAAMEPELLAGSAGVFEAPADQRLAFIAVPLKVGSEVVGVLVGHREAGARGALNNDRRVLTMAAALIAQSVVMNRNVSEVHRRMEQESTRLQKEVRGRFRVDNVIGVSSRMKQVFAEVHQAAPTRSTVLLRGESGTGKEAIARALHDLSPRRDAPFVRVNCAALSESLLESELFGHEKGAFTGAVGERKGRFEMAHGGTLFLDEIGDISMAFQAKLLRVLQEREFERVGGAKPIKVDVRLIFATNRNLEKMVQQGEFRADLYYRINVVSIFLPPLRERREDIPALATHFLERYNKENTRNLRLTPDGLSVLVNCHWPGNVRELENCVERTATMCVGDAIDGCSFLCHRNRCLTQMLHHLQKDDAVAPARPVPIDPPERLVDTSRRGAEGWAAEGEPGNVGLAERHHDGDAGGFGESCTEGGERERLIWALEQARGVQARAARLLNITPRQLSYALHKHDIKVRKF